MKNETEYAEKIKLKELDALNLPPAWREIYRATGTDLFLRIWQIASNPDYMDRNALYVPSIRKYYKLQNYKYIKALLLQGMESADICKKVKKEGIEITIAQVRLLRKKFNYDDMNVE